jgi:hypothetical protein
MNTRFARTGLALTMVALALSGCDGDSATNPPRLYLAPLDSELTVQLVEEEPPPF